MKTIYRYVIENDGKIHRYSTNNYTIKYPSKPIYVIPAGELGLKTEIKIHGHALNKVNYSTLACYTLEENDELIKDILKRKAASKNKEIEIMQKRVDLYNNAANQDIIIM